ncbi:hypothetical protein FRB96_004475 [Tulasnella sp. 330]|nr:hypothetical protein FRB96_004475 [Tulasnella sp. 330]KAG8871959.1 hypothetical protein FRB97_008169 [Tulasnella sp. 331]KAG8875558.1 hypothetical protein FRB98_007736 [Tulasnella sp. 332]
MRNATIVMFNLRGIAAETIKNIVLAGIGKLIIIDSNTVSEEDLGAGFLFRGQDVGRLRVDAARPNIEALNPLVAVETISDTSKLSDGSLHALLQSIDLFCVTDATREDMIRYDIACRATSTLFYAGGTYGLSGFILVDLLSHQHLAPDRASQTPKMIKQTFTYPPLSEALSIAALTKAWNGKSKRDTKDLNPTCTFSILALWEYQSQHSGKLPDAALAPTAAMELESISNKLISTTGLNTQVLQTMPKNIVETTALTAAHEFSPTCAILGGLLAQDILKALAGREPPYANFLTFDGVTGSATVLRLGMD